MNTQITETQSTKYDTFDFKAAYEKLFDSHQKLQIQFKNALDRIAYLEKINAKLEADNAYLKKMLFSKQSEKSKKNSKNSPHRQSAI